LIISLETGLRLGANSPDTRYTLPRYSLGYFWDTPLGWTGVIDGVPVNRDSVQFAQPVEHRGKRGESRDGIQLGEPVRTIALNVAYAGQAQAIHSTGAEHRSVYARDSAGAHQPN